MGWGTLIFSYIRWLGTFFLGGGQNFGFQYIFGVFRKINIFWGLMILWIFFGGHHKIGLYLGAFLCILGSFLKVKVQNGG